MERRSGLAVVAALIAAAGCSNPSPPVADGASDRNAEAMCTTPLSRFAFYCPASFDGKLGSIPCPFYLQHVYRCGDSIVLFQGNGYTSTWCVYDAASAALAGARQTTDYPAYCSGFGEEAGRAVDQACVDDTPVAARLCHRSPPDASPDAADDAPVSE
jgi:hypothetical protein